jgi:hypothetical protein
MIESIGGSGHRPPPPPTPMTADQRSSLQGILSAYDASSMDDSDYENLRAKLESSGIGPSHEVRGMLETAGLDLDRLRPDGHPGGPPPGDRPPPGMDLPQGLSQAMSSFVELYESGELSDEDVASFIEQLKEANIAMDGLLLDAEG